jgi:bifunctional non-homologous end joining protein LigD
MLATLVEKPFSGPGWVFEEKYDGIRILAYKEGNEVSLMSRNSINRTAGFPEIANAIRALAPGTLVLDGEIVVFDAKKVSRFQLLQRGAGRVQYVVFDCLYANGKDFRKQPLSERRAQLERLVKPNSALLLSRRLGENGLKAFKEASRRGLEGLIAKRITSSYSEGRSREWLKVKVHQEDEFVIGGFTQPPGARHFFGALLLGAYVKGALRYLGKVGTGFTEISLKALHTQFQPLVQIKSPFSADVSERDVTFLKPVLVAQVSYGEITKDGKLRQPVFLGLRDDKSAKDVVLQGV